MTTNSHYLTNIGPMRKWSETDKASRHFVTIQKDLSDQIKAVAALTPRKGWGSVRVKARIGRLTRETSIFPDKKSACYVLPIKASVRKELNLQEGVDITIFLDLI